jgi:hypothetical protein
MGGRLVSRPNPADLEDYARAVEEMETLLLGIPGIVAVYRTGGVSSPGISDIDRIAVVEGHGHVPSIWSSLSERSRYLAMHTPFLVDRETFQRHRWFAYLEPLELSLGSAVEVEDRPQPEYSERLLGAESLMTCLLRLIKQTATGRLKVRQLLCELNNVRHGLGLARLDARDAPSAWCVAEEIAELRTTWFALPEHERDETLRAVVERSQPALLEALWALGEKAEPAETIEDPVGLGSPWHNVALAATELRPEAVASRSQINVVLNRSAKLSELRWRSLRRTVPLHPAVLALLVGRSPKHGEFRATRDEFVVSYRRFLEGNGRGYSGIGLAMPFLGG